MKKVLFFSLFFLILGCAFHPEKLIQTKEDLELADFYPSKKELNPPQETAIVVFLDSVRLNAKKEFQKKFQEILLDETRIIISNFEENLTYFAALEMAFNKKKDYTIFVEQKNPTWPSSFHIAIYYNPYNKLVFNKGWLASSPQQTKNLRQDLRTYLPEKGFIVETKHNLQFAKINLGKNANVEKGDIFFVHSRKVNKNTLVGIYQQTNIQYSKKAVAQIKIVYVTKNFSWGKKTKYQEKIQAGMPVFLSKNK